MSLIQEALRRQQSDMDDNDGVKQQPNTAPPPSPQDPPSIARKSPVEATDPDLDTSPPPPVQQPPQIEDDETPPPPPPEATGGSEEDAPPPPAPEKKAGLKVALLVLGALLCLGLGVWAITFAVKSFTKPPVEQPGDTSDPATDPAETVPAPVEEPPPQPVPVEPVAVEPTPIAEPVEPVVVDPPIVVKPPVEWPILIVSGLVGKGAQGAVMFGTEIVGVGETIDGVRVVSITKQGAELEYEGEKKFVKVGGNTE